LDKKRNTYASHLKAEKNDRKVKRCKIKEINEKERISITKVFSL